MLQPAFERTGITSWRKLSGGSAAGSVTVTGTAMRLTGGSDGDLRLTIGDGLDPAGRIDGRDLRVGAGELRLLAQIERIAVGRAGEHLQRLRLAVVAQLDSGRVDGDRAGGDEVVRSLDDAGNQSATTIATHLVPTLRVGTHARTLRVLATTQSVGPGVPTRSVGTRKEVGHSSLNPWATWRAARRAISPRVGW